MQYRQRFYRTLVSNELVGFSVQIEESDLYILADKDFSCEAEDELKKQRQILKQYIKEFPDFYLSFHPIGCEESAPEIIKIMSRASYLCNVGPMATVAGAIAEMVGNRLIKLSKQVIIENGGDIFLMTEKERIIAIYAGNSPFSMKIGIKVKSRNCPFGVATSSATVGHSTSFGTADSVTVICPTSALADGLATYMCNQTRNIDFSNIRNIIEMFPFLEGLVVIRNEQLFVWGDLELVYLT
ncbi:MAG: UPF0280 family protein [Candidatus Omnitrophica bacterium]|nr:UPF0280 family protein [Candidatus Omnitrophota bacterium]MCM8816959.1 UPF0280 family protein [Candidatus Omnitrophota bacterium]